MQRYVEKVGRLSYVKWKVHIKNTNILRILKKNSITILCFYLFPSGCFSVIWITSSGFKELLNLIKKDSIFVKFAFTCECWSVSSLWFFVEKGNTSLMERKIWNWIPSEKTQKSKNKFKYDQQRFTFDLSQSRQARIIFNLFFYWRLKITEDNPLIPRLFNHWIQPKNFVCKKYRNINFFHQNFIGLGLPRKVSHHTMWIFDRFKLATCWTFIKKMDSRLHF